MALDQSSALLDFLQKFSVSFGSGDPGVDIALLSLVFSAVAAVLALNSLSSRQGKKQTLEDSSERSRALGGKLEKLERSLNEFRTYTLRSIEKLSSQAGVGAGSRLEVVPPPEFEGEISELPAEEYEPEEEAPGIEAHPAETISTPSEIVEPEREAELVPLGQRLKRSRLGLFDRLRSIFSSRPTLDPEMVQELRAQLIGADLGVRVVDALIENVKESVGRGESIDETMFIALMKERIQEILKRDTPSDTAIKPEKRDNVPCIVMIVGVNGAGKTTSVAKLSAAWKDAGAKVLMVAADTFRAAAVDQLTIWGERLGIPVVSGAPSAKPATVVFDAMQRASQESFDVIVIDTAGRLHTKVNLMQELAGVKNAIQRHYSAAPHEVLLVVDGSTGQNALSQAREFNDAVQLTGVVVTKLDGTPKGGIVVAIKDELNLPVRYIGVGESAKDLRPFAANDFVDALFDVSDDPSGVVSNSDSTDPTTPLSAHGEQRRRRRAA